MLTCIITVYMSFAPGSLVHYEYRYPAARSHQECADEAGRRYERLKEIFPSTTIQVGAGVLRPLPPERLRF